MRFPDTPARPVMQRLLSSGNYPRVQDVVRYDDLDQLLSVFDTKVLRPAFQSAMRARGIEGAKLPRSMKR